MNAKTKNLMPEFAKVLGCKETFVQTRLIALGHQTTCNRCGGGGQYSYCQSYGTTCFGCQGAGKVATPLTVTLLKTVTDQVANGELKPYLAKLAERRRIGKLVGTLTVKINDAWSNLPTIVADKAAGRIHFSQQSERQTDLNHFCCPLSQEADVLIREMNMGRFVKGLNGARGTYTKLSDLEEVGHLARLEAILNTIQNAETLAPQTRWDEVKKNRVNV